MTITVKLPLIHETCKDETRWILAIFMRHFLRSITNYHYKLTNFCINFKITLKSMWNQCHGECKSFTAQLNPKLVRRIELCRNVCTGGREIRFWILWICDGLTSAGTTGYTLLKYVGHFATHAIPCIGVHFLIKIIYDYILLWKN